MEEELPKCSVSVYALTPCGILFAKLLLAIMLFLFTLKDVEREIFFFFIFMRNVLRPVVSTLYHRVTASH